MRYSKTIKLFVLGTVVLGAIGFLSTHVQASAKPDVAFHEIIDISIAQQSGSYTSPVYSTKFKFNIIGLTWRGTADIEASLRLYSDGMWSEWYGAETNEYIQQDAWFVGTSPVIASSAEKVQYRLHDASGIQAVKLMYLNTESRTVFKQWNVFDLLFSKAVASESLNIITRSEWEADEEWRFDSEEEEVWPAEYQWPEKFVIHHTAGDDGSDDPEGTIRGVYYWHAVVLGWGDIGYNYVIDQEGNIYEGRYGGDSVIGAHVYRSAPCAQSRFGDANLEANFNNGSIGVAVLGDYETSLTLNTNVKTAFATLIAHKGRAFDINPTGESKFIDNTYKNVVGHRDLDCTHCPGENLYTQLDSIRTAARKQYVALGGIKDPMYRATLVDQIGQPLSVNINEKKELWVEFRNDGNTTWRSYSSVTPTVIAKSAQAFLALAAADTDSPTLITPNVPPGGIGRFVFTITAPSDALSVTEEFILVFNGEVLPKTTFSVTATVTGLSYAAELDNQDIMPAMFVNATQTVVTQFKNLGTETWEQGDVQLNIYDLGGAVSRFYYSSWPDEYGEIDFVEESVAPNELATFTFTFASPDEFGLFYNRYSLTGVDGMVQQEDRSITRVDSTTQAELVEHNIPPAVHNTWRYPAVVTFKNIGLTTWDRTMILYVYDIDDSPSRFHDGRWIGEYAATRLVERSVKPGEIGTFEFLFNAPDAGLYFNRFQLEQGNITIQNSEFTLITRVDEYCS